MLEEALGSRAPKELGLLLVAPRASFPSLEFRVETLSFSLAFARSPVSRQLTEELHLTEELIMSKYLIDASIDDWNPEDTVQYGQPPVIEDDEDEKNQ